MNAAAPARKRRVGWLLAGVGGAALLGVNCVGWWIVAPRYLEVDIPMPLHATGVRQVWEHEIRARVRQTDDRAPSGWDFGAEYVLRREGIVDPSRNRLTSEEQILRHCDRWLTAHGWVASGAIRFRDPAFPEGHFLPDRYPGVRHYVRSDDTYGDEGAVVIGVWPTNPRDLHWFTVVLVTTRPSFLRRLFSSID